jgi:hypothetical protein
MKTTLICTAVLAIATSFSALAKEATATCIDSLASDGSLNLIADKVALAHSNQMASVRILDRVANEPERAAVALWLDKRQECFDAGSKQRRAAFKPQEIAFARSVFVFQQRLVADLQSGRLTYAEFNKRRLELVDAAGHEI